MKHIAVVLFTILLSGCAITAIDPDKPATVGDIVVDPQLKWADIRAASTNGTVWTVDGLGLDELHFYPKVVPGHTLYGKDDNALPHYDASMLPDDIEELFSATLGRNGFRDVHTDSLKPTTFGTANAVSFHLSFATPDGLEMDGLVLAAQRPSQLDAIMFVAPREFYFGQYKAAVERIFASARFE